MAIALDKLGRGEFNPDDYNYPAEKVRWLKHALPQRKGPDGKAVYYVSDLDALLKRATTREERAIIVGMSRSVRGEVRPENGVTYTGQGQEQLGPSVVALRSFVPLTDAPEKKPSDHSGQELYMIGQEHLSPLAGEMSRRLADPNWKTAPVFVMVGHKGHGAEQFVQGFARANLGPDAKVFPIDLEFVTDQQIDDLFQNGDVLKEPDWDAERAKIDQARDQKVEGAADAGNGSQFAAIAEAQQDRQTKQADAARDAKLEQLEQRKVDFEEKKAKAKKAGPLSSRRLQEIAANKEGVIYIKNADKLRDKERAPGVAMRLMEQLSKMEGEEGFAKVPFFVSYEQNNDGTPLPNARIKIEETLGDRCSPLIKGLYAEMAALSPAAIRAYMDQWIEALLAREEYATAKPHVTSAVRDLLVEILTTPHKPLDELPGRLEELFEKPLRRAAELMKQGIRVQFDLAPELVDVPTEEAAAKKRQEVVAKCHDPVANVWGMDSIFLVGPFAREIDTRSRDALIGASHAVSKTFEAIAVHLSADVQACQLARSLVLESIEKSAAAMNQVAAAVEASGAAGASRANRGAALEQLERARALWQIVSGDPWANEGALAHYTSKPEALLPFLQDLSALGLPKVQLTQVTTPLKAGAFVLNADVASSSAPAELARYAGNLRKLAAVLDGAKAELERGVQRTDREAGWEAVGGLAEAFAEATKRARANREVEQLLFDTPYRELVATLDAAGAELLRVTEGVGQVDETLARIGEAFAAAGVEDVWRELLDVSREIAGHLNHIPDGEGMPAEGWDDAALRLREVASAACETLTKETLAGWLGSADGLALIALEKQEPPAKPEGNAGGTSEAGGAPEPGGSTAAGGVDGAAQGAPVSPSAGNTAPNPWGPAPPGRVVRQLGRGRGGLGGLGQPGSTRAYDLLKRLTELEVLLGACAARGGRSRRSS